MSYWNYRLVNKDEILSVHEVYYNKKDKPISVTVDSVAPLGESLKELKRDFKYYKKAFKLSVLNYEDFRKEK